MASGALSRRVEKLAGYPPLCDMGDYQRREFHEALLDANSFEDLPVAVEANVSAADRHCHFRCHPPAHEQVGTQSK